MNGSYRKLLRRAGVSLSYFAFYIVLSLLLLTQACASETEERRFDLDADLLTYDSETETATAEGNVKLSGSDMEMFAGHAVYDVASGLVTALPNDGGKVTMNAGQITVEGDKVDYNVITREGIIKKSSGKMDAIFFKGGDAVVMPVEEALSRKLISRAGAGGDMNAVMGFLSDSSATTCTFDEPHYKFVSKKVTVILGKRVILKTPQMYLDKRMIFQYPFDYIIPLNKGGNQNTIMPSLNYDSDKGVGLGIKGPFVWRGGQLSVGAMYWTDDIIEAEVSIQQDIGRDLTLFARSNRLYNKDEKETLWRPQWGIMYNNPQGWTAMLRESQRELVKTEMRPGLDKRYNVWRTPEFTFSSPWFRIAPSHFLQFGGIWGNYQDNMGTPEVERVGGGVQIYGEPQLGGWPIMPFYDFEHRHFDYSGEGISQRVTDMLLGFRWNIGSIKFGTAYVRRFVGGNSPLVWDKYLDREDLYQQIAIEFPGHEKWETWGLYVRAGYDFVDSQLNEMVYSLSYNKHCLTWQLYVRDSRPKDEISMGLRFIINAYPDKPLDLNEQTIYDPFERPVPDSAWNK